MRGNLVLLYSEDVVQRSIPAHAGQPFRLMMRFIIVRVYPRACGATKEATVEEVADFGLSPRMRGNRLFF